MRWFIVDCLYNLYYFTYISYLNVISTSMKHTHFINIIFPWFYAKWFLFIDFLEQDTESARALKKFISKMVIKFCHWLLHIIMRRWNESLFEWWEVEKPQKQIKISGTILNAKLETGTSVVHLWHLSRYNRYNTKWRWKLSNPC